VYADRQTESGGYAGAQLRRRGRGEYRNGFSREFGHYRGLFCDKGTIFKPGDPLTQFWSKQAISATRAQLEAPQSGIVTEQLGMPSVDSILTHPRLANTHLANPHAAICAISRKLPMGPVTFRMPFDARSI
jgi:hypothetical protein